MVCVLLVEHRTTLTLMLLLLWIDKSESVNKECSYVFLYFCQFVRIVKKNRERKLKEKQEKKSTDRPAPGNIKPNTVIVDRKHLHNYRVVQRNLLYVIGLPAAATTEEILRKAEFFGQYGKISKVVVHKTLGAPHASISAYVTFTYKEDAKAAIQALDSFWIDGHPLRASFGTTKYCNNFIRNVPCTNPECVYLHELGEDDDRFTKEEIQVIDLLLSIYIWEINNDSIRLATLN